jgi:serine/threonine protein kinase
MDLLEGENLEVRRERKGGVLEPREVLSLMDAVLDTLQAAHDKGVVHRDIKPENLFLTVENTVRLLDFGIAHINVPQNPGQTLAGVSMGTPAFMPPEQASAHWDKVDAQSDIWAVGASMFTLLTGRYVHQGGTVNESLVLAVTKPAPRVESINPSVPRVVSSIVNKALERDKSRRYQSALEMQQQVREAFHQLQGDLPEADRYSLSDGSVGKHSLPPRVLTVNWDRASAPNLERLTPAPGVDAQHDDRSTFDDLSSDEIDRKSFRPMPDRRWLFGAAALLLLIGLVVLFSGGDEPAAHPTTANGGDAPLPSAPSKPVDNSWSELRQSLTTTAADGVTEAFQPEPLPDQAEGEDEDAEGRPNKVRRGGGGRGAARPAPGATHRPGHDPAHPLPEDFDPLAERE